MGFLARGPPGSPRTRDSDYAADMDSDVGHWRSGPLVLLLTPLAGVATPLAVPASIIIDDGVTFGSPGPRDLVTR